MLFSCHRSVAWCVVLLLPTLSGSLGNLLFLEESACPETGCPALWALLDSMTGANADSPNANAGQSHWHRSVEAPSTSPTVVMLLWCDVREVANAGRKEYNNKIS